MSLELVTKSMLHGKKGKKKKKNHLGEKDPLLSNKFTFFKILNELLLYIYIYISRGEMIL